VSMESARGAVQQVYSRADTADLARKLAMKQVGRLKKLEPAVARRRLIGTLQRRGFDYEVIKSAVAEALGQANDD
jgi:regulatory protein